jgi:hypothetical protein
MILRLCNAVSKKTGYGLDGREVGVRVPVEERFVLLPTSSKPVLGFTRPI